MKKLSPTTGISALLMLILCWTASPLQASEPQLEQLFESANAAYEQEAFQQAASLYDSLYQMGYESAILHYNLGNAHYRLGQTGPAILNYERALQLKPGFEDAVHNLGLAQARAIDRIVPVPDFLVLRLWKRLRDSQSSGQWAFWAVLMVWIAMGGGAWFLLGQNLGARRLSFAVIIGGLLFAMLSMVLASQRYGLEQSSPYAIVMATNVYVKSAPDQDSNDLFILHEGAKVELTDRVGEWQEVRLADGKKGWIQPEKLENI
jgi:tetratricopeptide (TPR) repeat protein